MVKVERSDYFCVNCNIRARYETKAYEVRTFCDFCGCHATIRIDKEPDLTSFEANQKWIEFCALAQKEIEDKAKWRGTRYNDDF